MSSIRFVYGLLSVYVTTRTISADPGSTLTLPLPLLTAAKSSQTTETATISSFTIVVVVSGTPRTTFSYHGLLLTEDVTSTIVPFITYLVPRAFATPMTTTTDSVILIIGTGTSNVASNTPTSSSTSSDPFATSFTVSALSTATMTSTTGSPQWAATVMSTSAITMTGQPGQLLSFCAPTIKDTDSAPTSLRTTTKIEVDLVIINSANSAAYATGTIPVEPIDGSNPNAPEEYYYTVTNTIPFPTVSSFSYPSPPSSGGTTSLPFTPITPRSSGATLATALSPTASSKSNPNDFSNWPTGRRVGVILGIVVGSILIFALIAVAAFLRHRRKTRETLLARERRARAMMEERIATPTLSAKHDDIERWIDQRLGWKERHDIGAGDDNTTVTTDSSRGWVPKTAEERIKELQALRGGMSPIDEDEITAVASGDGESGRDPRDVGREGEDTAASPTVDSGTTKVPSESARGSMISSSENAAPPLSSTHSEHLGLSTGVSSTSGTLEFLASPSIRRQADEFLLQATVYRPQFLATSDPVGPSIGVSSTSRTMDFFASPSILRDMEEPMLQPTVLRPQPLATASEGELPTLMPTVYQEPPQLLQPTVYRPDRTREDDCDDTH